MKTATQTPPAVTELTTIEPFILSRAAALRVNPEMEGKRVHQIILSLVLDNGFSLEGIAVFPVATDSSEVSMRAWRRDLVVWLYNLGAADLTLFYSLKFIA